MVGVLGTVAAGGVFGLFSATTQNAGNEISTGTVALSDNDNGSAMFNVQNAKPGDSWTRCIKISYSGTLAADVRHYIQATPTLVGQYMTVKIETGTQAASTFPDCTGFVSALTQLRRSGCDLHRVRLRQRVGAAACREVVLGSGRLRRRSNHAGA